MKTIAKLILSVLVVFACLHGGAVYWRFYQLKDRVREIAQFAGDKSDAQLQSSVAEAAARLDIPVTADQVSVERPQSHLVIAAHYVENIEWVPTRLFPHEFNIREDVLTLR